MSRTVAPEALPRGARAIVVSLAIAGGLLPIALFYCGFLRHGVVTPRAAKAELRADATGAALVDVRPAEDFAAGRIDTAVSWPLTDVLQASADDDVPATLRGKTLYLICKVGDDSLRAARHLASLPASVRAVAPARPVRGGIQEWIRDYAEVQGVLDCPLDVLRGTSPPPDAANADPLDRWRRDAERVEPFAFRSSPLVEQATAMLSFYGMKAVYTLLSLAVVLALWGVKSPDLAALRWAMASFFLGENACALNYFLCRETSYLLEYLHSYGMLVCFGLTTYAVLEALDRRLLGLSDPKARCAALPLCGRCIKTADVPCGLRRVFWAAIPTMVLLCLMLPLADWQDTSYTTRVIGRFYHYSHLRIYQIFENWYCAAAAAIMFAASGMILACKEKDPVAWAKIAFAAGTGPWAFGMLRMILAGAYDRNRVWYLLFEEATELAFVLSTCWILWTFRHTLLPQWRTPTAQPERSPA